MKWYKIDGFDNYLISKKGEIFSKHSKRKLSVYKVNGYPSIRICKNGKAYFKNIHRLLALTFIPNPENLPEVNHIDGNRSNNDLKNLEWVTTSRNQIHAYEIGLTKPRKGEQSSSFKLTYKEIQEIRHKWDCKIKNQKELSIEYNVHRNYISEIVNRKVRVEE